MEYVYSAMLLHAAGKEINEKELTKVLKAPGIKVDEARVKALVSALEDIDIDEAIKQASFAPAAPVAAQAAPEASAKEAPAKEEEEEKEEEKTEEEAIEGLGALFG